MSEIRTYLQSLHMAMAGSDPALVQDALAETEAKFRRERERLAWAEPMLSGPEAVARILASLGAPEDRAETYRQRERVVAEVLAPAPEAAEPGEEPPPARPWPSFFGVFLDPRAYTSLVYLLMAMFTGVLYFTWAVTGLCLSLGFLILIIGLPLLVLFLGSVRALGLGEGRLVEAMLDVRMPRRPPLLPEGKTWVDRLKGLFVDSYTWKCLVYLVLHLPLGILSFTFALLGITFSLALVAAPLAHWIFHEPIIVSFSQEYTLPIWVEVLLPLGGILGLAGTLHLALGLGRMHGAMARALLVRR
ncbi:sensor domain-containing protein [Mesoterricola silvestris]|uniref:Membrane protein n=1 Tax=Mesoterricola silvestris TaxID=2927979 RepID=A0AA48GG75_9BACT|nr:sensor domain-containing protein [Mesoterricola silvestris]BDU72191.1 membrane protein [Mesoterricola silvestris]